jgi:hypothetical protein
MGYLGGLSDVCRSGNNMGRSILPREILYAKSRRFHSITLGWCWVRSTLALPLLSDDHILTALTVTLFMTMIAHWMRVLDNLKFPLEAIQPSTLEDDRRSFRLYAQALAENLVETIEFNTAVQSKTTAA